MPNARPRRAAQPVCRENNRRHAFALMFNIGDSRHIDMLTHRRKINTRVTTQLSGARADTARPPGRNALRRHGADVPRCNYTANFKINPRVFKIQGGRPAPAARWRAGRRPPAMFPLRLRRRTAAGVEWYAPMYLEGDHRL
ncbi:hypothetical protein EVAR_23702_1 [Eumeta japonica]|uniref:Uncharacterized protein n=1 Tax=Eumeta variegata TaxID=151549 RepID=A0A4C1VIX2_EUMVA|nr:hypothetical protein EVAR_23702_1 [Eumeta japonica]